MLAAQAVINAGVFGLFAILLANGGLLEMPFVLCASLASMFAASAIFVKTFGRLLLIVTWLLAITLIAPHLPGGFMDGGAIGMPIFLYLIAGFLGACFLLVRDSPAPGIPPRT